MTSPPYYGLRDYGEDGQIGLEDSLDAYIDTIVDVADHIKRVLRDDGSFWLNLGDSYSSGGRRTYDGDAKDSKGGRGGAHRPADGFQQKQKMLVPHRVAIALQDAGWVLRNDVVWKKPNPMPESATDRLSQTFEYVFHLTPNPDYYYDLDAIREPCESAGDPSEKNPGDIFEVTTKPLSEAHFAVYPPELCEKPIQATCPRQVCAACGTGYTRDVEEETVKISDSPRYSGVAMRNDSEDARTTTIRHHKGWSATCDCDADTEPGVVLDPFAGAGTTCMVAKDQNRRFVGIELNPDYRALAQKRVGVTVANPERLLEDGETALTDFTNAVTEADDD